MACVSAPYPSSQQTPLCAGEDTALWVEEADGAAVARITEQSQLEQLLAGLNRRGMRERALIAALKRRQKLLADTLAGADPGLMPDVLQQQADRCVQDTRAVLSHAHLIAQQRISCFACPESTWTSCMDALCTSSLALSYCGASKLGDVASLSETGVDRVAKPSAEGCLASSAASCQRGLRLLKDKWKQLPCIQQPRS